MKNINKHYKQKEKTKRQKLNKTFTLKKQKEKIQI